MLALTCYRPFLNWKTEKIGQSIQVIRRGDNRHYLCCLALVCSAIAIQGKCHMAILPILVCEGKACSQGYLQVKHTFTLDWAHS